MSQALNIRHTAADSTARLNAQSSTQVKRYWPGKVPEWADKEDIRDSESESEEDRASEEDEPAATTIAAPVVLKRVSLCLCSKCAQASPENPGRRE